MKKPHINIKVYKKTLFLFIIYFVILHAIIFITLSKSNILHIVSLKLGGQTPEITQHYKTMLAFHLRAEGNMPDRSIIIIGDSITQGLCVSCISHNMINYGIGNDTTLGVINRIKKYKSINHAKAIVLAIGINDLARRNDKDIIANFREIISIIPKMEIVVSSILPVDEIALDNPKRSNTRIRKLNLMIGALCAKYTNCSHFDSGKKLSDSSGNLRRKFHDGDGVHLNTAGYLVWISDIRNALKDVGVLNEY